MHNRENEDIIRTPFMDQLASSAHGIRLERFYSQPICTPTRSQTLTGRYQIHTGLQHGVLWKGQRNGLPPNETTAAEHLKRLGYSTHAIGKWVRAILAFAGLQIADLCVSSKHLGFSSMSMTPMRRGFDNFFGFWGGSEDHWWVETNRRRPIQAILTCILLPFQPPGRTMLGRRLISGMARSATVAIAW